MNAFSMPAAYGRAAEVVAVNDLNAGDQLNFQLDDELNQRQIVALDVWSVDEISVTPAGNEVVSLDALTGSTLTLQDGSDQKIKEIPLRTFRLLDNGGIRFYLTDLIFNMQSSYIRIGADGLVDAGQAYYLTFWYDKKNRYDAARLPSENTFRSNR
jgi:hypothetical protein